MRVMKLRFTLRDLFWLTLVIALSIALWLNGRSVRRETAELERMRASLRQVFMSGFTTDPEAIELERKFREKYNAPMPPLVPPTAAK
jgi:hypothetical protein